ncbi:MAG: hypothetical protein SPK85_04595 [Prevotella sp.]|nr:hypothetical protein [Prevotella sp.]
MTIEFVLIAIIAIGYMSLIFSMDSKIDKIKDYLFQKDDKPKIERRGINPIGNKQLTDECNKECDFYKQQRANKNDNNKLNCGEYD